MPEPLVSVCTITYNHEPYLREAMESVLSQETSFEFEFVIGEDCSTDHTREIALEYQKSHPGIVRVLPSVERLGANGNFERTFAACRGRYVALLEGDDFWTSPHKLQRQVDVFEEYPDISVVFHPVRIGTEPAQESARLIPDTNRPQRTTIRDILKWHYMHTASIMVRNPRLHQFPKWLRETYMGDWPIVVLCAQHGDIHFIPEPMAVYRPTREGIWTSLSHIDRTKHWMEACLAVDRGLSYKYHDILLPRVLGFCYSLAMMYQGAGLLREAREEVKRYWRAAPLAREWRLKLGLLLGIQYPRVWRVIQGLRGRPA